MPGRGLLTRWELALGVVLLLGVAAWAAPVLERATWRTRRAEAEMVLASLSAHQVDQQRTHGAFQPFGPIPQPADEIGRHAVPWGALPAGWTPPLPEARCAYGSTGAGDAFRLVATCDVDGDGVRSTFSVRPGGVPERATPEDVY